MSAQRSRQEIGPAPALGLAFRACADAQDRIGGASRCQAGDKGNQADQAPGRFRADENDGDQYQADSDPEDPVKTANIPDHGETFVEFMIGRQSAHQAGAAIRIYTERDPTALSRQVRHRNFPPCPSLVRNCPRDCIDGAGHDCSCDQMPRLVESCQHVPGVIMYASQVPGRIALTH